MPNFKVTVYEVVEKGSSGGRVAEREHGVVPLSARTLPEAQRAAREHVERSGWTLRALSTSSPEMLVAYVTMPVKAAAKAAPVQQIKRAFGTPRS